MKMIFKAGRFMAAALVLLTVSGCINAEYVGQSFPVLPETDPVAFFTRNSPLPDRGYHPIGRVLLTAPPRVNSSDIIDKLGEIAREHGANAVEIVEYKAVRIGMSAPESDAAFAPNVISYDRDTAGGYIWENSFGEPADLAEARSFLEIRVKARLLVTNERYRALEIRAKQQKSTSPAADRTPAESAESAADAAAKRRSIDPSAIKQPAAEESKPTKLDLTDDRNGPVVL